MLLILKSESFIGVRAANGMPISPHIIEDLMTEGILTAIAREVSATPICVRSYEVKSIPGFKV